MQPTIWRRISFQQEGIWIFMRILDVNGQTSFFTNLRWMEKGIRQQWRSDLSDRIYEIFIPAAAVCQCTAILSTKSECWKKKAKGKRVINQSLYNIHLKHLNNWFLSSKTRTVACHVNVTQWRLFTPIMASKTISTGSLDIQETSVSTSLKLSKLQYCSCVIV